MQELIKMIGVLTLISALAGGLLALTDNITREPIKQSQRAEKMAAMRQVLPEYDNDPIKDTCVISVPGHTWTFYRARRNGKFAGAAFEASSDQGYSGTIRIMAGVSAEDKVSGVAIIEQMETPGLGARIAEPAFTSQFRDRGIQTTRWAVTKDGGNINAITGATISPRAVVEALKTGLDVYEQNKQRIAAADSKD